MKITVEFDSLDELLELQVLVDAARAVKTAKTDPVEKERTWYLFEETPPPVERKLLGDSNTPIEKMRITTRSYNCLKNLGLKTVGEVAKCSAEDLRTSKNFGRKSLNEIKDRLLDDYGLQLRK